MPCNQRRLIRVAIQRVTENVFEIGQRDRALLDAALCELQIPVKACQYDGTTLTIRSTGGALALTVDQIKEAYSNEVVKATAKRFGWLTKTQDVTAQQETRYTFAKR